MKVVFRVSPLALSAAAALVLAGGCSKPTPPAGDGARGYVDESNAGAMQKPVPHMQAAGGPSGQTPAWGKPGGVPAEIKSSRGEEALGARDPER